MNRDRNHFLMCPYRRSVLYCELRMYPKLLNPCRPPRDTFGFNSGVIDFSIIKFGCPVRTLLCHLPVRTCPDPFYHSILIFKYNFAQESLPVPVQTVHPSVCIRAHRPASCCNCSQSIFLPEHFRNVIALILELMAVGSKAGGEIIFPCLSAIYCQFINSHRRRIYLCRNNITGYRELLPEHHGDRGDMLFRKVKLGIRDPLTTPGASHLSCRKHHSGLRFLSIIIFHRQMYLILCLRLKRFSAVDNTSLLCRLYCPSVYRENRAAQQYLRIIAFYCKGKYRMRVICYTVSLHIFCCEF